MSVLQFYMLQELAKELNGAGFPNIQDVQHRQGREFLTPDGRVTRRHRATLPSWQPSEDQAQTVGPPPARSSPRSEPHSEPVHIVPRPSSPALCQSDAKGYLLPDFYSGCATGIPGRLTEGLLLWRSQLRHLSFPCFGDGRFGGARWREKSC